MGYCNSRVINKDIDRYGHSGVISSLNLSFANSYLSIGGHTTHGRKIYVKYNFTCIFP